MLIHQYDAHTGQYLSSRLADADPLNADRWLIPAFSTVEPLPVRSPLQWPFYLDGAWVLLPDWRGRILYRQDTGEAAEILMAGTTPADSGLTNVPRPSDEYVWVDGAWAIDPAVVAQKKHAATMAEFESRMSRARAQNQGKADAIAAGLLSREEAYYFRAWSAYQLALVRAIQADGFPDDVSWPDDPAPFDTVAVPVMTEFDARMAKAKSYTDGREAANVAGTLSPREAYEFREWTAYQASLSRALESDPFPAIRWPDEPSPWPEPASDA
jgi:hypothetical protein